MQFDFTVKLTKKNADKERLNINVFKMMESCCNEYNTVLLLGDDIQLERRALHTLHNKVKDIRNVSSNI